MIAVHGLGYVGLTAAVHWAQAGETVLGYDPDPSVVTAINEGRPRAGDFLEYLGFPVRELVHQGRFRATSVWEEISEAEVHILAVPTERGDAPDMSIVLSVLSRLALWMGQGRQIWVESTLVPGTVDRFLTDLGKMASSGFSGSECLLGLIAGRWNLAVCPRRDWFADPDKNLGTLQRVVGGVTMDGSYEAIHRMQAVSPSCLATTYRTAELTKALENALLHIPVMFAHELARRLPDHDVAEALHLAGTHWRLPEYHIGFGTGGRCVPLGSQYLVAASQSWGISGILGEAILGESTQRVEVAHWAKRHAEGGRVLVAGIAYRPGFKDAGHSPGLSIATLLKEWGVPVQVHDPRWAERELLTLTGIEPGAMDPSVTVLLLATAHPEYASWPTERDRWTEGQVVLDAHGSWAKHAARLAEYGVTYVQVGRPGWLD